MSKNNDILLAISVPQCQNGGTLIASMMSLLVLLMAVSLDALVQKEE